MPKRRKDLLNQRFGKLVVLSFFKTIKKKPVWLCRCDCGGEKYIISTNLTNNQTKSCGCLVNESAAHARTFIVSRKKKVAS